MSTTPLTSPPRAALQVLEHGRISISITAANEEALAAAAASAEGGERMVTVHPHHAWAGESVRVRSRVLPAVLQVQRIVGAKRLRSAVGVCVHPSCIVSDVSIHGGVHRGSGRWLLGPPRRARQPRLARQRVPQELAVRALVWRCHNDLGSCLWPR